MCVFWGCRAQQVLASQEGIRHEETEVRAEEIPAYWTGG